MPRLEAPVTACIPYYKGQRYICRAVQSLLTQTHRDLQVIVMNDGDTNPPWADLMSLRDPRLVCFDLQRNHGGPFFAYAVVANTVTSTWFLIQEQDDWSDPRRLQRLLHLAATRSADVALSAQFFHRENPDGTSTPVGKRWQYIGRSNCPVCKTGGRCTECFVDTGITGRYRYRAPHAGLFRLNLLRRLGGYYAGLHLHYDSLLMNLLLMTGTVAHAAEPLYHRLLRPDSITHSTATGFGTEPSNQERITVAALYEKSYADYQRYVSGKINSNDLVSSIRARCQSRVTAMERQELAMETARLRARIDATLQYA